MSPSGREGEMRSNGTAPLEASPRRDGEAGATGDGRTGCGCHPVRFHLVVAIAAVALLAALHPAVVASAGIPAGALALGAAAAAVWRVLAPATGGAGPGGEAP